MCVWSSCSDAAGDCLRAGTPWQELLDGWQNGRSQHWGNASTAGSRNSFQGGFLQDGQDCVRQGSSPCLCKCSIPVLLVVRALYNYILCACTGDSAKLLSIPALFQSVLAEPSKSLSGFNQVLDPTPRAARKDIAEVKPCKAVVPAVSDLAGARNIIRVRISSWTQHLASQNRPA